MLGRFCQAALEIALWIWSCQINRCLLQEEDRVKAETDSFKAPLDHITLELHNLLYERNYYMKAINTCKDFKSRYPDIQLVSEEEFFKDAPVELKRDSLLREDGHKLMLQRLHFELHQVNPFTLLGKSMLGCMHFQLEIVVEEQLLG